MILVSNFGYGWYTDTVSVQTQYKAFTTEEIIADVGLHIGLRGINITLKGTDNTSLFLSKENLNLLIYFQVIQLTLMVIWLVKPSTTTNSSTGQTPGPRVVLDSDDILVVSTKNSEQHNSVACLILYCG